MLEGVVTWIYYGIIGVSACFVLILMLYGGRRIRLMISDFRERPDSGPDAPELSAWPCAAVMVPVTGTSPVMFDALLSIARQEHPDFELLFITEDKDDPACAVIGEVMRAMEEEGNAGHIRHVVAGRAVSCGQKNHNLLAGIRAASDGCGVFAFFDSSHVLPAQLLKNLLTPIALGRARASTGYHHVRPADGSLAGLGRAVTVVVMYMLQEIPLVTQPWGGSMAITREYFDELDMQEMWNESLTDDVSLALRMVERKGRTESVVTACQVTDLPEQRMEDWLVWLARQWVGLRIYFFWQWVGIGVLLILLLLATVSAPLVLAWGLGSPDRLSLVPPALSYILFMFSGITALRAYHPWPGPWWRWAGACLAAIVMAPLAHVRTWNNAPVCWRHYCYRVARGGRVLEIFPRG